MSDQRFDPIRIAVHQKASNGETIDVYALAQEFRDAYPGFAERDLIQVISDFAARVPGASAVWHNKAEEKR